MRLSDLKIRRALFIWIVEVIGISLLSRLLSGFSLMGLPANVLFTAVLGILNALFYPFLIRLTLPITVVTFGLFSLVINAFLIYAASRIAPGVSVDSLTTSVFIAIGIAAINTIFSSLFAVDDDDSYYRNVVKRAAKRGKKNVSKKPGIIFLEIDGLSHPVFQRAIQNAYMPNLASWLRETHHVVQWETDLSAATPACQAGLLLGSNADMPAFRWYDRKEKKIFTLGDPKTATMVESVRKKGHSGLLARGGLSVNNMFSGGAQNYIFTSSKLMKKGGLRKQTSLKYFFLNPYNFTRTIALMAADIYYEMKDNAYQKHQNVIPRLHRGGSFPIIRAVTTVAMRDMGIHAIIGNLYSGVNAVYATFVGYDEVAHHAGVERSQAMYTLQQLDKQFAKIKRAADDAPRKYHIVVLSDHGQSQGETFLQRYDYTLEEYIKGLLKKDMIVENTGTGSESWERVNTLLTEIMNDDNKFSQVFKRSFKDKMKNGQTKLGPDDLETIEEINNRLDKGIAKEKLIVMASGNLGIVYFSKYNKRLTYEEIMKKYPKLIPGLSKHEGIGFIMVTSKQSGPVVIGPRGKHFLKSGRVLGTDPLKAFGEPNAVKHLIRTNSFKDAPDILINSFYRKGTDEIAAFEELIGAHGGLGGNQNKPFVMYPIELEKKRIEGIVGAEKLHKVFLKWTK